MTPKQEPRGKNRIDKMIIPIRCFSCGKPVAQLWETYKERIKKGEDPKKVMDDLGLKRYCCRALFLGHVDLLEKVAQYKKF
jgi:DNA-directed RNA polymerase subunit N